MCLSCHFGWRDKTVPSRHRRRNAALSGLWENMARQKGSAAPTRMARQSFSDAPMGMARPKEFATPPSQKCSPFWTLTLHGAAVWLCRANNTGATSLLCRAIESGTTSTNSHATEPDLQPFLVWGSCWRGSAVLSCHPYWCDKTVCGPNSCILIWHLMPF